MAVLLLLLLALSAFFPLLGVGLRETSKATGKRKGYNVEATEYFTTRFTEKLPPQ